ncbi:MAG: 4Fe-4S binding protein [Planctomycetota bacterium]|jgi:ferredoxin
MAIKPRTFVQLGALALTLAGVFLIKGNAERWCPLGGVEALYTYVYEGNMPCSLAVSNFYILGALIALALLFRRIFCSHLCPIGAMSEWLQKAAAGLGIEPARIPAGPDRILSLLKYPLLAVILYFTWRAGELIFRGFDPCYALISRHGEDITLWTYIAAAAVVVLSLFFMVPFCRWLCPLAAILNLFSRFSLGTIRRDPGHCTGCGSCTTLCPMAIPVDEEEKISHARCTFCLDCIRACPEQSALTWGLPIGGQAARFGSRTGSQAAIICVLLLIMSAAVSAAYVFPMPSFAWAREEFREDTAILDMGVEELGCRGRANLLVYYLDRDDELELPGPLRLEAWPGPGVSRVRIFYDAGRVDETMIRMAVTEAYYDSDSNSGRPSPFRIEGYDPFDPTGVNGGLLDEQAER